MIELSIIIISYNTKNITKKCLETVITSLQYEPKIQSEIIVVDNASTDESVEMLKKIQFAKGNIKIKIIENVENTGFTKANNQAVKQASGKYLLFLNSDIEVIDNAIPTLVKFFKNQKEFDFIGAKLLNKDMSPQPSCGPFYTLPVVFGALFLRGDYWGLTRYSPTRPGRVDWVSGACILTTNANFQKVKGFDEKLFMYMDEIDLFYRATEKGMRVGFFPSSEFIHLGSASSRDKTNPILQVYKGFIYFYKEHRSPLHLVILIIMLKLKARLCILLGKLLNKVSLVNTYEKALETVGVSR